mgnify:CR=1 FL=1
MITVIAICWFDFVLLYGWCEDRWKPWATEHVFARDYYRIVIPEPMRLRPDPHTLSIETIQLSRFLINRGLEVYREPATEPTAFGTRGVYFFGRPPDPSIHVWIKPRSERRIRDLDYSPHWLMAPPPPQPGQPR